jgi:hypothetical protein
MMNLEDLIGGLRSRPEMYLPDTTFNTLVAFLEGYNAATDGQFLDGFSRWLQEYSLGYITNYHWQVVIAAVVLGVEPNERWRDAIDEGFDRRASDELLHQLERFLSLRKSGDRQP